MAASSVLSPEATDAPANVNGTALTAERISATADDAGATA